MKLRLVMFSDESSRDGRSLRVPVGRSNSETGSGRCSVLAVPISVREGSQEGLPLVGVSGHAGRTLV